MTKENAIEIATKYANDIWLFGGVDKECVSKVCRTLLNELDIANKKINDYNEMIIKVISECEEMINDRYYMNDTAILKKAELIKGIANHYYIVEPKLIGGE